MSTQTNAKQQGTRRAVATLCGCLTVVTVSGCLGLNPDNEPPVARARVLVNGQPLGAGSPIPFDGNPVTITLDGSESSDADGSLAGFVWKRTDVPAFQRYGLDAGAGATPAPAFTGDPADGQMSQAMLTEKGNYRFSLWVRDNDGAISKPASVSIKLGGYTPDMACVSTFAEPKMDCQACTCTPNDQGGCLDEVNRCFNNSDAMFATLCSAVVNCVIEMGCGTGCYTQGMCTAEIDAAGAYMGDGVATCLDTGMADTNPCAAASALASCQSTTSMCTAACM